MRYVLYNHLGSANHGCEALVRTVSNMLGGDNIVLLSDSPAEEKKYGVTDIVSVYPSKNMTKKRYFDFIYSYFKLKLYGDYHHMDALIYKNAIDKLNKNDVLVSIGGDIYCYDDYPKHIILHQYAAKRRTRSILIGCSIEQKTLEDISLVNDLKSFEIISAREQLTYNSLRRAGVNNVIYCPDSAFCLEMKETTLPSNFIPGDTVGINISPLVLKLAENPKLILDNLAVIISDILENTSASVALIPHVVWDGNNDLIPLKSLYQRFEYSNRVCLIQDHNAQELKWIISQCSYFICSRTHASIAAYSTGVPTLVLGYSVKSKGIAADIFGTYDRYVVPYQQIKGKNDLLLHYQWIKENANSIRETLMYKTKEFQEMIKRIGKMIDEKCAHKI